MQILCCKDVELTTVYSPVGATAINAFEDTDAEVRINAAIGDKSAVPALSHGVNCFAPERRMSSGTISRRQVTGGIEASRYFGPGLPLTTNVWTRSIWLDESLVDPKQAVIGASSRSQSDR